MGNNNVTPAKHAFESYSSFLKEYLDDENVKKLVSGKNIVSNIDHNFSVFVDDLLVNDEQLQEYTENGKQICLGALMFIHSTIPYESLTIELIKNSYTDSLVNLFNNMTNPEEALAKILMLKYVWDGSSFYEWSYQTWTRCSEDSLNCSEFIKGAGLETHVRTCGLTQKLVVDGISLIDDYRKSILDASSSFKESEVYVKAVESLKSKTKKFDKGSNVIPCYSGVIEVTKATQRNYKPNDFFLTKLPYDPTEDSTELVSNFVSVLNCNSTALATTLLRCGVSTCCSLTIISGPKSSGKSTVLSIIKALYGPFVCTQADFETGGVNTELIRTCLIDDSSFLSEDKVRSHPISNLVVTCDSSSLLGIFGGRKVNTLVLSDPIADDAVKNKIVTNLSTRKQLGVLLGWCLQNYDPSFFAGDSSSSILRTLIDECCCDFNCSGCGGASRDNSMRIDTDLMSMDMELNLMSGVRVIRAGPNGKSDKLIDSEKEDSNESGAPK